jgi:hypothetical protein
MFAESAFASEEDANIPRPCSSTMMSTTSYNSTFLIYLVKLDEIEVVPMGLRYSHEC